MTYESHVFKPSPQKISADKRETLYIVLSIAAALAIYVFVFGGFIMLLMLIAFSVAMAQLKINDIKKKGPNRFGSLPERLSISSEKLVIGNVVYPIADLDHFKIIATDFVGKPDEFFYGLRRCQ